MEVLVRHLDKDGHVKEVFYAEAHLKMDEELKEQRIEVEFGRKRVLLPGETFVLYSPVLKPKRQIIDGKDT